MHFCPTELTEFRIFQFFLEISELIGHCAQVYEESGVAQWSAIGCTSDMARCVVGSTDGFLAMSRDYGDTWSKFRINGVNFE
jgi:hypothetical protein